MNGNIKFSVVVPVYKVEKLLDACVESIRAQSYENFELILVDDGSPDDSGKLCDEWARKDSRIKVIHKVNQGALAARVTGIEQAAGDYVVFADSDDYVKPFAFEVLYNKLRETPCDCIIYSCEKRRGEELIARVVCADDKCGRIIDDKRELYNIVLNGGGYNAMIRKCVKRTCFDGRDYSPYYHIKYGEDQLQSLEIYENARSFVLIADILYIYRENMDSVTRTINYDDHVHDNTVEMLVDKLLERENVFLPEDYDRLRNMRLDILAMELRRTARFCSSAERAEQIMAEMRGDSFIGSMAETGYRAAAAHSDVRQSALQKFIFHRNIALFRDRRFRELIREDRLMSRLTGR